MKAFLVRCLLTLAVWSVAYPAIAQVEEPILERYSLRTGQNADGVGLTLTDKFFGGGTARGKLVFVDRERHLNSEDQSGYMVLHVRRVVRPGEVTFALLCFGIQVRGFDSEGNLVYSKDLPGFTFGDSKSGRFARALRQIPVNAATLEVTYFGNYE